MAICCSSNIQNLKLSYMTKATFSLQAFHRLSTRILVRDDKTKVCRLAGVINPTLIYSSNVLVSTSH